MKKNILVLGGAGYIGSHAVLCLQEKGNNVVVYDNLSTGHREAVGTCDLVVGENSDREKLEAVLRERKIDVVMHFAASCLVGESVKEPLKYYENNVSNAIVLLRAMIAAGVKDLVFSSTCAVFGEPRTMPMTEDLPKAPINAYGESKLMIEQMLARCGEAYGIRYVSLRYFNAAGADEQGRTGEDHDPETHIIPIVLQAAQGKRDKVSIFGTDYPTDDGTCVRDYIHVADLAEAHYLAMEYLEKTGASEEFNLGNGKGFSVKEVIRSARKVTGREIHVEEVSRRPGDPPVLIADAGKAKDLLGWKPEYTDIDDIVATAWNWQKKADAKTAANN